MKKQIKLLCIFTIRVDWPLDKRLLLNFNIEKTDTKCDGHQANQSPIACLAKASHPSPR
jgi:hypothetical protein